MAFNTGYAQLNDALVCILHKPVGHAYPFHPFKKSIMVHEERPAECDTDELAVQPFHGTMDILHGMIAFRHHIREHATESIGDTGQLAFGLELQQQATDAYVAGKTQMAMRRVERRRDNEGAHQFDTVRVPPVLRLGTARRYTS